MTDAERIELLKQVARVAPKEWESPHGWGTAEMGVIRFDVPEGEAKRACYLGLFDDIEDAAGIIAMLDAMRKREAELTNLVASHSDSELRAIGREELIRARTVLSELTWRTLSAEAVARVFVQVFGGGKE